MSAYWTNLLILAGINGIAAWALGLAMRSGQLSVGHAALAGIGGYAAGWLYLRGGSVLVTVLFGVAFTAIVGAVLSALMLRLNHLFIALATLVFGEIAVLVATESSALGGAAGLVGLPLLDLRPIVGGVVVAILLVELLLIRGSRLELQLATLAKDPQLVEMAGGSATRIRIAVFAVSAGVAGLAGVLNAYYLAVIQPVDLGFERSLDLLVYAVVGGAASGFGPLLGAAGLTLLPEVLNVEGTWATLLLGAVLLLTMLLRRDGIVGRLPVRVTRPGRDRFRGGDTPSGRRRSQAGARASEGVG